MLRELRFSWTEFKLFVNSREKSIQWFDRIKFYHLIVFDGQLSVECFITKTDPTSADQTEFETIYKNVGNQSLKSTIVRQLSQDNIMLNPRTMFISAAATPVDKKIISSTGLLSIRGGYFWIDKADWDFKDTLAASVIDKDDILGLGGTPTNPIVLNDFIPKTAGKGEWGIVPNVWNELIDESISSPLPNGLYFRAEIIKDGGTKVSKAVLNLNAYEV